MDKISLGDIDLSKLGHEIQMCGTIWSGNGISFVTQFPDKDEDLSNLKKLIMDLPTWEQFLRQTDLLETEIFALDPTGKLVKTIVRKTQRQIDTYMQWAVFKRDSYTCRYCGRTGIPLTVDHIDLWENGGGTFEDNLVSACRKCNKDRGRMEYDDWINSAEYQRRSANLDHYFKTQNLELINKLEDLKSLRVTNIRSR